MKEELKKILYAEDDESIAEVVKMTLEDMGGFEVKHCFLGQGLLIHLSSMTLISFC